jgi:Beta-1,3-glucanase
MFGLPITITVDSSTGSQTVGLPNGSRNAIFSAFQADPTLKNLIVSNGGTNLRVIALDHGIDSGVIPANYLDAYVDQVWSYYQSNTLMLTAGGGVWTGGVSNGSLNLTQGGTTVSLAKPTSTQVFGCGLQFTDGGGGTLGPPLCAGFNRGTLIDGSAQPDYTAAHFYTVTPTNAYSKIMHQYNISNLSYGFPNDDAGGFSAMLSGTNPTTVTITLSSF